MTRQALSVKIVLSPGDYKVGSTAAAPHGYYHIKLMYDKEFDSYTVAHIDALLPYAVVEQIALLIADQQGICPVERDDEFWNRLYELIKPIKRIRT